MSCSTTRSHGSASGAGPSPPKDGQDGVEHRQVGERQGGERGGGRVGGGRHDGLEEFVHHGGEFEGVDAAERGHRAVDLRLLLRREGALGQRHAERAQHAVDDGSLLQPAQASRRGKGRRRLQKRGHARNPVTWDGLRINPLTDA